MANTKTLIGGQALRNLGSDRYTNDVDYLINDKSIKETFITSDEVDYINANGNKFFLEIWNIEKGNEIASAQSLFELKAYSFVQHCQNFNWQKVASTEYDMKFLAIKFGINAAPIAKKYMTSWEYSEVLKVLNTIVK